ncbi:hypothetical protein Godav_019753, partial [Gossypium davidsonii]|nr:hypothetical protein [Gossypium davidsonii]
SYTCPVCWGCKLDPTLISALVERWTPETHTFQLPCSECTITLKDVQLQLGLLMDGLVSMGSMVVGDWSSIFEQLLSKVPDKFSDSRIEMKWLQENFQYHH